MLKGGKVMIDITEPLVTSRFKVTDFKRSCVLNSNASYNVYSFFISI